MVSPGCSGLHLLGSGNPSGTHSHGPAVRSMSNLFLTPSPTFSFHPTPLVPQQDTEAPGCLFSTRSPRLLILRAGCGGPFAREGGSGPAASGIPPGCVSRWCPLQPRAGPGWRRHQPRAAESREGSHRLPPRPRSPRCRRSSFRLESPRDSGTPPRARPAPCRDTPGAMARQRRC